jgi:hypothetical protein
VRAETWPSTYMHWLILRLPRHTTGGTADCWLIHVVLGTTEYAVQYLNTLTSMDLRPKGGEGKEQLSKSLIPRQIAWSAKPLGLTAEEEILFLSQSCELWCFSFSRLAVPLGGANC